MWTDAGLRRVPAGQSDHASYLTRPHGPQDRGPVNSRNNTYGRHIKIMDAISLDSVLEIERAIDALTLQQIEELYAWLDRRHAQAADAQLKADLDAGRIDDRINRAVADYNIGNTQPL